MRNFVVVATLVVVGLAAGVLLTARMDWTPASVAQQNVAPPVNRYAANVAPYTTPSGESPFVAVAKRVGPTVVNITVDERVAQSGGSDPMEQFFQDSPFWEFFHRNNGGGQATPQPRSRQRSMHVPATGSGIIIGREGYILTNNHVVADADKITVRTQSGKEYKATVVGKDPDTDVALIKVEHSFEPEEVALIGNSDSLQVGDWSIAMGNPLGLDWTLTVGVISAKGRSNLAIQGGGPSYQNFIQTDASINFGNSGGPLCNIHGEVIAMNSAINPSGQGIGFAIPINLAMRVVDQIRTHGSVTRGYLGILPRELTPDLRSALGITDGDAGVFVERVDKGTPAEKGGLKAGDVITELNGKKINDVTQFRMAVADEPPGSKIAMHVLRDGKPEDVTATLGDRSKMAANLENKDKEESAPAKDSWMGVKVEPVTDQLAKALELDGTEGVIITEVDPDGPANGKLQERDVIIEIDRKPVNDIGDFRKVSSDLKSTKKAVLFRIIRNGQKTFEAIEP
ncbi:MAG TPA: Do family serine endopeptidase [bacterium]